MDEEEDRLRRTDDKEGLKAYLDKKYPRMAEPDEEGIDLHPADPRRRFIATWEGVTFSKASPLTEEDLKAMHNNYMLQVQSLINQKAIEALEKRRGHGISFGNLRKACYQELIF